MKEQGNVNYGDDGESRSYSIQVDPFFKFTHKIVTDYKEGEREGELY